MRSHIIGIGVAASLMALAAAGPAKAACTFSVPDGWAASGVRWFGPCVAGAADGRGVLRAAGKDGAFSAFYGELAKGQLEFGVVETPQGYRAGRFADGKAIRTDDRQTYVEAFRVAAEAAEGVSRSFKSQNNPASARFYAARAAQLREQIR